MSTNRILVEEPIYDEFVAKFTERVANLKYGDPSDPAVLVGPIINDVQLESLKGKIALAKEQGARVTLDGPIEGRVVPPHVFADVKPDMEIASEEIFGPLVGIIRVQDEDEAVEVANATEFGLSSAIFTADVEHGVALARRLKAGMTHINDMTVQDEPHMPFGGEKNSGLGRFGGDWAIHEFTTDHWISVQMQPRPFPV
jgi:aldehyde dehydrogenase (NAD+)